MKPEEIKTQNLLLYQLKTFVFAFRGIVTFFRIESKAFIHLIAALLAFGFGWYLHIAAMEWLFIVIAVGLVFIAELFNTIAELLADLIQPARDKRVAFIKDMAAGAVLVAAAIALVIGMIIFVPKISALFQ